jgi:hypothetical protein
MDAPLRAHHHLVLGLFEDVHGDFLGAGAGGQQGRLVDQVLQVGAGEAGRAAGDDLQSTFSGGQLGLLGVDVEDLLAAADIGQRHHHLAVEAAGPEQGRVEDVLAVGGGDDDHAVVGLEAVHLHQQLVEGLLALVVTAAQTGAAMAADRVDLVDEDDAGRRSSCPG